MTFASTKHREKLFSTHSAESNFSVSKRTSVCGKYSRRMSADPALQDYIPSSPDAAGNLPGMGGVYNLANLNLYHYGANNPVKFNDPTGREAGYVMDEDSVGGAGHAGLFVKTDEGYSFFEVSGTDGDEVGEEVSGDNGKAEGSEILSKSNQSFPTAGSANSSGKARTSGVKRRDFKTKDDMMDYLKSGGSNDGYESIVEFNTTPEQDKAIFAAAQQMGKDFKGYNVFTNQCGIYAKNALAAGGIQGNSGLVDLFSASPGPNSIGATLLYANPNASLHRIKKHKEIRSDP